METTKISANVEATNKEHAQSILSDLGLSLSRGIDLYFRQIVRCQGLPFEVVLDGRKEPRRWADPIFATSGWSFDRDEANAR